MTLGIIAPALAGLAGWLGQLGTNTANETAMYPIKKQIKALYGDNQSKQSQGQGLAPLMMQSSDPANQLAGQITQNPPLMQQMAPQAPPQGQGLFGDYFSNPRNETRRGIGDAIASIIAVNQGQNPAQVIALRRRQQFAEDQAKVQQQQYQQETAAKQQQLAQEQAVTQQELGLKQTGMAQENQRFQQQMEQSKAEFQAKLLQQQQQADMAQKQFQAEMGLRQQQLGISQAELGIKQAQIKQTQEAMKQLGAVLFPEVAQGVAAQHAQAQSQYTPEQKQLLAAAMASDPTGKTALTMAAQMQKDANAPLTEAAANATMFANRASKANEQINTSDYKPGVVSGMLRNFGNGHPLAGPAVSYLLNEFAPGSQEYNVWAEDFTRAALRKESGATITPDEDLRARQLWIPQPNDTPQVLEAKRVARQNEIEGMLAAAGPKGQRALGNMSQQPAPLSDEQLINKYAK